MRKRIFIALFIAALLACVAAISVNAYDINLLDDTVVAYKNNVSLSDSNGQLYVNVTGDDPYFTFTNISLDSSRISKIFVFIKYLQCETGTFEMFFTTPDVAWSYDACLKSVIDNYVPDINGFRVMEFDTEDSDYWDGMITALRFDIFRSMDGDAIIDHVCFCSSDGSVLLSAGVNNNNKTVIAWGACGASAYWSLDKNGIMKIYGTGDMYDYSYKTVDGVSVSDAPWTKYDITDLIIGNGITGIGNYAFYGYTGLSDSLIIAESVTDIGSYAFSGCSISSVYFNGSAPSVTAAGNTGRSFNSETVMYYIPGKAGWPSSGTWNGYTLQPVAAIDFGYCGDNAKWILDTDGVLTISGTGSMYDYKYSKLAAENNPAPWIKYSSQMTRLVIGDGITGIGDYAFYGCDYFEGDLVIPDGVTVIGEGAFCGCSGFDGTLKLSDSLTSIGYYAFEGCNNLYGIVLIPETTVFIDKGAFHNCPCLCKFYFCGNAPEVSAGGIDSIGASFEYDVNLYCIKTKYGWTDAECYDSVTKKWNGYTLWTVNDLGRCGDNAFWIWDNSNNLFIYGSGATYGYSGNIYEPWYKYSGKLNNLVIDEGITDIGECSFMCCAFSGSATIPNTVEYIRTDAFNGSTFDSLKIPNTVQVIEAGAFDCCHIKDSGSVLIIPDSVISIGDYAFSECGYTDVIMGSGVESIGSEVFCDAPELEHIYFKGNAPTVYPAGDSGSFTSDVTLYCLSSDESWINQYYNSTTEKWNGYNLVRLTEFGQCGISVYWALNGQGVLDIFGKGAMFENDKIEAPWIEYKDQINTLNIGEGITRIGNRAFYGCSGITGCLTLPESLTEIGDYAFYGCAGFDDGIVIGSGVTQIGSEAFVSSNINNVYFKGDAPTAVGAESGSRSFKNTAVMHYIPGRFGWPFGENWENYNTSMYYVNDLNGDGKENISDAVYLLWCVIGKPGYKIPAYASCDYDGNNTVNSSDAVCLLWRIFYPSEYIKTK